MAAVLEQQFVIPSSGSSPAQQIPSGSASVALDVSDCSEFTVYVDTVAGDEFEIQIGTGYRIVDGQNPLFWNVGTIDNNNRSLRVTSPCAQVRIWTITRVGPIIIPNRVVRIFKDHG